VEVTSPAAAAASFLGAVAVAVVVSDAIVAFIFSLGYNGGGCFFTSYTHTHARKFVAATVGVGISSFCWNV